MLLSAAAAAALRDERITGRVYARGVRRHVGSLWRVEAEISAGIFMRGGENSGARMLSDCRRIEGDLGENSSGASQMLRPLIIPWVLRQCLCNFSTDSCGQQNTKRIQVEKFQALLG